MANLMKKFLVFLFIGLGLSMLIFLGLSHLSSKTGLITFKTESSLNLELRIKEPLGIDRIDEPVTSGIPLPKNLDIKSIDKLRILDSNGKEIPAQFKVLARWDALVDDEEAPIKWLLLDFQANVNANSKARYYLRDDGEGNAKKGIEIRENETYITIDTGKALFKLSKQGKLNLFDSVIVDGKELIDKFSNVSLCS